MPCKMNHGLNKPCVVGWHCASIEKDSGRGSRNWGMSCFKSDGEVMIDSGHFIWAFTIMANAMAIASGFGGCS